MVDPALPSRVGKRGVLKMPPDGVLDRFTISDEIVRAQSGNPSKMICLQRVTFDGGRREVRLGYYIIGKLPKMRGRWVWGQYATFMPLSDFKALVDEAKRLKWF
jgi:hypothetical protein